MERWYAPSYRQTVKAWPKYMGQTQFTVRVGGHLAAYTQNSSGYPIKSRLTDKLTCLELIYLPVIVFSHRVVELSLTIRATKLAVYTRI